MTVYTNIFGGTNISPSTVSYAAVTLTANTSFDWPLETAPSSNLMATIMDITSSSPNLIMTLPNATEASNGQTVLINNVGANTFIVQDYQGTGR